MRGHRNRLVSFTSGSFVCRYPSQTPEAEDTLYLEWGGQTHYIRRPERMQAYLQYHSGDPVHGYRTDPVPYHTDRHYPTRTPGAEEPTRTAAESILGGHDRGMIATIRALSSASTISLLVRRVDAGRFRRHAPDE